MTLKERLEIDIKAALLGGEKLVTEVLRGLKSAILYEEVAQKRREEGLDDTSIELLFLKLVKQREESAALFDKGGNHEAAKKERVEKEIIQRYLPPALSEEELRQALETLIDQLGASGPQAMGKVLGKLRADFGSRVDSAKAAAILKELLA